MPAWQASGQPASPAYAGFWARFAALLIDWLLQIPVAIAMFWPMLRAMFDQFNRTIDAGRVFDATGFAQTYRGRIVGATLVIAVIGYLYQAVMVGMWGATVGKFALSVRVRRSDGSDVGWREAFLRPLLQAAVSVVGVVVPIGLLGPLDYLWMLWDRQKQTLHDKVARTIVVRV